MSDFKLVCVDIETNGLSLDDNVLAISLRALNDDGTPTVQEFYSLIRNTQPLNPDSFAVNGITREQLSEAPTKDEVLFAINAWHMKNFYGLKLSPIGHNFLGFDKPRAEKLLGRAYNNLFDYHSDDSMVIAQALQRAGLLPVKSCSLKNLAAFFDVPCTGIHTASADTYICGMVYSKLLKIITPSFTTRVIRVFNRNYLGV